MTLMSVSRLVGMSDIISSLTSHAPFGALVNIMIDLVLSAVGSANGVGGGGGRDDGGCPRLCHRECGRLLRLRQTLRYTA